MFEENGLLVLSDLLPPLDNLLVEVAGDVLTVVRGLAYDSHAVGPGDLFICIPGERADGHGFADEAIAAGAVALCVERKLDLEIPQIVVKDARIAMARLAAELLGRPADELLLLGITGTNGKTTTAFLLEGILAAAGRTPGLIGTIETRVAGSARPGVRTTPESLDLHKLFAEMLAAGVDSVAMEVTSHGLALHRVDEVRFAAAGFTNLSQDHLDFHAGMDDYFAAKAALFTKDRCERAAINIDDSYGRLLREQSEVPVLGFGTSPSADVRAEEVNLSRSGSEFVIVAPGGELKITTSLVGPFNVSNCLAAAAVALQAGIDGAAIEEGIRGLRSVPGRFEGIEAGQPFAVIVDYAHTPDSLDNVLGAARTMAAGRNGRVVCVFGCGGDRDRGKRPLMGSVAARRADVVVVTSDNPRREPPESIIEEILAGVRNVKPEGADFVDADRRRAIREALRLARRGDVVVIAGKGHETGQEFADRIVPFDDRLVARSILEELGRGGSR